MDRFTRGIAVASARHPWRTIASWVLVLGAVLFLAASGGGSFIDDFAAHGSQSQRANELLDQNFPEAAQGTALVVLQAEDGTTLRSHRDAVTSLVADVGGSRPRRLRGGPVRGRHGVGGRHHRATPS